MRPHQWRLKEDAPTSEDRVRRCAECFFASCRKALVERRVLSDDRAFLTT
ncbi:hypothetical protein CCP2SC5_820008 [Azospirillaceae bacterium]